MENIDGEKLLLERRARFRNANAHRPVDRVPYYTHSSLWHFLDAGYTTVEANNDYEILRYTFKHHMVKYRSEMYEPATRNPLKVRDTMGPSDAYVETANGMNAILSNILLPEDYDLIAEGKIQKAIWEHGLFGKFKEAENFTPQEFAEKAKSQLEFDKAVAQINQDMREIGCLNLVEAKYFPGLFFEALFNVYRGIKPLAMDLRRCPDKVKAACDYMNSIQVDPAVKSIKETLPQGGDRDYFCDAFNNLLAHTILTRKQFDTFMAEPYSKILGALEEKGGSWFDYSEGSWIRFADFFNQYKKGTCAMQVETDDIYEMRRLYPNIAVWGGLSVDVLGNGTPEQCVDMAKKAINELGEGFVLMPNKMISYSYDCKAENLLAVSEYVNTYNA